MKQIKAYILAIKIKGTTYVETSEIFQLKRNAVARAKTLDYHSYAVIPCKIAYDEKGL